MRHRPEGDDISSGYDMQEIGNFLSFASRGDRVGLIKMLRDGISPDVQDYDRRTALHLASSEGHAPIVELLLHYKANVNLIDRWNRTPLTDARLYGHKDICRILEVNGGKDMDDKDFFDDEPMMNDQVHTLMTVRCLQDSNEVIDISELDTEQSATIEQQGVFGVSMKVKWRGTWVVKTIIKNQIQHPIKMVLTSKDNTLLQKLRHPNILQFLGSIVQGEEMILITEYLPKDNLELILKKKLRLDFPTALRYALDIAKGLNYLHEHKPKPIVHNHLHPRNLFQDESGRLKIGEYWVQMLYEQIQPNLDTCLINENSNIHSDISHETGKDVRAFGFIFYQMLEGSDVLEDMNFGYIHLCASVDFELKFPQSRCPKRVQQVIEQCTSNDPSKRLPFYTIIEILDEVSDRLGRMCMGQYCG